MKIKENLKYLLRNSWDVLPIINEFQLIKHTTKTSRSLFTDEKLPSGLKIFGRIFLTSLYLCYGVCLYANNSISPLVWSEKAEERYIKAKKDKCIKIK